MDLYSSDYAGIQEGNMRSKSVMDRNQAVVQHNNDLGGQIAQLKSSQKSGDTQTALLSATQQFWAGGKLPSEIKAFQSHIAQGGTLLSNPTTVAQKSIQAVSDATSSVGATTDVPELAGAGAGAGEGASAVGDLGDLGETFGSKALKGLGGLTSAVTGGIDIYKDIDSIANGHGISGDNWEAKTSNLLQIGGSIADVGGTVFPPLALVGGVLDIASGAFGEIGSLVDSGKQAIADTKLQVSETLAPVAQTTTTQTTGRVS